MKMAENFIIFKFDNLSVKTYLSFNTATPTVDLCMDIGHIELH